MRCLLFIFVVGISFSNVAPLRAQVSGATISGLVTDPTGASVANATVTVTSTDTGISASSASNSDGAYTLPNLRPASYEVVATAVGFNKVTAKVTVSVGEKLQLNLSLTVGNVSQSVQVTTEAPQVDLTSSTVSGTVEDTVLRELPLNGRDWTSLATLEPGVATVRTHTLGSTGARGSGLQMTISGSRPTQNVYRLDGAIVNDYSNAGPGSVLGQNLGVDAIQEFSVLTSNYSAEYGFTSGGVINAVTKSGTNAFHGTAFDFLRNDKFDANNFFANSAGIGKPPLRQNQFGGSAGWRILKNRLFLFGDYEGVRQNLGSAQSQFTISDAVRGGRVANLSTGVVSAVPIDPTIQKFLAFFPHPNGPAVNANVGQYNWTSVRRTTENYVLGRGDMKFSDKDSMAGTYERDLSYFFNPNAYQTSLSKNTGHREVMVLEETHIFTSSVVNSVRLAYAESTGLTGHADTPSQAINPVANDPSLAIFQPAGPFRAPSVALLGTGIGTSTSASPGGLYYAGGGQDLWNQIYQIFDDAFITRGNHGLKFGFNLDWQGNDFSAAGGNGGGSFTAGLVTPENTADCTKTGGGIEAVCGALVDFLTNQPFSAAIPAAFATTFSNKHYLRSKTFGVYAQDDWRFRPNLTLNLGLRYEMQTNPTEVNHELAYLPTLYSAPTPPAPWNPAQLYVRNPTLKNFEPRVGFAWDPFHNGKTSIRGGFGVFDALPAPYENQIYTSTIAPYVTSYGSIGPPSTPVIPKGSWPYSIATLGSGNALTPTKLTYGYTDVNIKRNYIYQYNFNIQRQVTPGTTVVIAYTGSRGFHHPFLDDSANSVLPVNVHNPIPGVGYYWPVPYTRSAIDGGQSKLLNPNVGPIRSIMWEGQSWYDGLQVKVNEQLGKSLTVQGSFTWAHSIDNVSGSATGDTFDNEWATPPWWDLNLLKGSSAFNIGRNLVISALYLPPTPKALGPIGAYALGRWQLGLIPSISDGVPWFPTMGMDNKDLLGEINPTINPPNVVVSSDCASLINPRNPQQYLKQQCFSLVPQTAANTPYCDTARAATLGFPGTCPNIRGDLGRNSVNGPGLVNVDFSMVKNNRIPKLGETGDLQFRAEFFNVFNRANFGNPPTTSNGSGALEVINSSGQPTSGFARITTTETPNRQIQFALKLIW